jgi:hypothetical protein
MKDVLVLDLEPYRGHPELARAFVLERAGDFTLLSPEIEEVKTPSRPSKDPEGVIRNARKLGVERGCDLVLVLRAGNYFGKQRGPNARIRERGYAFVVVGERIAASPNG